ncbi:MAG: bile acid:sodium symporter, partial [Muribaculaceae bacterium]|nr:bile acid:sodium symporter [Muribaculaceae bacterium]
YLMLSACGEYNESLIMQKYKSFVLPISLVLGYFLRQLCSELSGLVPYVIFAILVLTFSGVRLSTLRPSKLDFWIASFQTVVSISFYLLVRAMTADEILAQGALMCVLCPVASSVTVVASMLGANPVRTTTYTIVGNLLVAFIAPVYISIVSDIDAQMDAMSMFLMIFARIAVVIALPFIVVWLIQRFLPKVNSAISVYKSFSFYLWAFALFVTIGQTLDFVVMRWNESCDNVLWLGIISLFICFIQFSVGRMIGKKYNDRIAGGQLLGQKNSAMGIWMLNTFLNPIASVGLAFYSIWQNLFNSWQIFQSSRNKASKS